MKEYSIKRVTKWLIPSILITVGIIIIFLISTWLLLFNTRSNPAYTAAKPIETALLKQGAVKKCETGDPGLGPDNDEPWYEAYYEVQGKKAQAVAIIESTLNQIISRNSYPNMQREYRTTVFHDDANVMLLIL